MNKLDNDYKALLQDILDNGTKKQDRTGTGTISVFGRQIRHKMSEGFPLLTTKKMYFKGIVTELLWFLRGDTNIKFLLDNDCHIWDGDAWANYSKKVIANNLQLIPAIDLPKTKEEFINKIKTDRMFAFEWGELGPIYGAQWRRWFPGGKDQIQNLINDLRTNPDSRRLLVNSWNVGELSEMVLPPCHYGFQVYTRELSLGERTQYKKERDGIARTFAPYTHQMLDGSNIPTRAISLMWNQRSVDTPLGLPFNIASYGLLLEIIAKAVNMVPDELIGNLGDCHIYSNQIDGCKEQIGRDLTLEERRAIVTQEMFNQIYTGGSPDSLSHSEIDQWGIPKRTREPYPLPQLLCKDEYHYLMDIDISFSEKIEQFKPDFWKLENYQSHPKIVMPLSN